MEDDRIKLTKAGAIISGFLLMAIIIYLLTVPTAAPINSALAAETASGSAISVTPGENSQTGTPAPSQMPSEIPSPSVSPSVTPSVTPTPTATPTPEPTRDPNATPTPSPTPTPKPTLLYLLADYSGGTAEVGEEIDKSKFDVTAFYSDGSSEKVKVFDLSAKTIEEVGPNKIILVYKGCTASVIIMGKELRTITVAPIRMIYGKGNAPDERDLTVIGYYTDGTSATLSGYKITPEALAELGNQNVTVSYKGFEANVNVYVKDWSTVKSLSVSYDAEHAYVGELLNKKDITVTAVYADGSTERITTYTLGSSKFGKTGANKLKVSYAGLTAETSVDVIEKKLVGIRAEYNGATVQVGQEVRKKNLKVYAAYDYGDEVEITDYTIHSPVIRYLGDNTVTIYYGDFTAEIEVSGIEVSEPDFTRVSEFTITQSKKTLTMATALPTELTTDCVAGSVVKKTKVSRVFRKLKVSGQFIAFEYGFYDTDDEAELPLAARITIPEEFDISCTYLYFTPNRKSIIGRMSSEVIDEKTIETTIFKAGTYLLVYSEDFLDEQEAEPTPLPTTDDD